MSTFIIGKRFILFYHILGNALYKAERTKEKNYRKEFKGKVFKSYFFGAEQYSLSLLILTGTSVSQLANLNRELSYLNIWTQNVDGSHIFAAIMEFLQNQNIDIVTAARSSHGCQAFCYLIYFSLFGHNIGLVIFFLLLFLDICDVLQLISVIVLVDVFCIFSLFIKHKGLQRSVAFSKITLRQYDLDIY